MADRPMSVKNAAYKGTEVQLLRSLMRNLGDALDVCESDAARASMVSQMRGLNKEYRAALAAEEAKKGSVGDDGTKQGIAGAVEEADAQWQ